MYQLQTTCYPDNESALSAFSMMFPTKPSSDGNIYFLSSSSINNGLINYTINPSVASASQVTGTLQLSSCTEIPSLSRFDKVSTQDIIVSIAFLFAFFVGFGQAKL